MPSVTQRIKQVKQPRGGYINPRKMLTHRELDILKPPYDATLENVSPSLVGIAVDYLMRFMSGAPVEEVFQVSFYGARRVHVDATQYADQVMGLDDASIVATLRLSGFDTIRRAGLNTYRSVENIKPNAETIENVRAMVEAGLEFFREYGPIVHTHMTFQGGYTDVVGEGDGDFMTADAIWDFKCSRRPPTSAHTLQIVMYWVMGLHSWFAADYQKVTRLGLFNPRLTSAYTVNVVDIPIDTLRTIETQVICYDEEDTVFC